MKAGIFSSLQAFLWPSSAKHAPPRTILVNQHNKNFASNTISNTKYNILTFIPKSLSEQFSLRMNQYFLGLAILQLWHDITPVNPISTWLPLIAILSISIGKELLDDLSRLRRDRVANLSKVTVIADGVKKTVYSKDIRVGDIVFVKEHDEIRADIVLLKTSHSHGLAYSETAALDGERDYKERRAVSVTQAMDESQLFHVEASITCEAPNPDIERFNGTISIGNKGFEDAEAIGYNNASSSEPTSGAFGTIPLSSLELLLQGTFLKNTDWVYGVAVYTGNETKIGKNKHTAEMKWTKTDNLINTAVIFIFLLQVAIMLLLGTAGDVSMYLLHFDAFYLGYKEQVLPWFEPLIIPLRFLLLCSLMIPQSLKITSDIAKYMLSMFISWDKGLYDKNNDTPPAVANSNTCEELGYIKYMFTDKTGTLTENVMHFKKCVIDGKMYEETGRQTDNLLADHRIQTDIQAGNVTVTEYMRTLVLCNTVFSSITATGTLVYRSPSPDEEALVNFAKQSEVVLEHRDYTSIRVNVLGKIEEYDIIHVLPFSSKRRRMSIIVRKKGTEDYVLYSKGADDVISERVSEQSMKSFKETSKYVDEFAGEGLRVLCMTMKPLSEMDLRMWEQEYKRASVVLEKRTEMMEAAADKIEKDLTFLGASAIEDALQDKVPETIQALREAGIVIWMLTGDKLGTAVQIGRSCKLINDAAMTKIMHIQANSPEAMELKLNELLLDSYSVKKYKDICVVIEGVHLRHILDESHHVPASLHRLLVSKFKQLAAMSSSVICCRVNPIQKANVVRLMKEKKWNRARTLAVGDGGNDVAMLQEADVGVGISGKEGLQAVRAADYGVSRFKYLKRLVLIHGRNCNQKVAVMSHYTIYKSLLIAFNQLLFSMHSGFSGAPIFDGFILACYNTFFTAVLPLVFVFDNPVSDKALKNIPELYADSQKGNYINMITLALTFLFSLFQGLVFSVCTFFTFSSSHMLHQGKTLSYGDMGLVSLTMIMTTHVCMVFLASNSITFMTVAYAVLEYFLFLAFSITFSFIPLFKNTNEYYVPLILLQEPTFYWAVMLAVIVAVMPAFLYRAFIQLYNLNLTGYLQQRAPTKLDAAIAFVAPIFKDYVQFVRHKEVQQPKSARSTAFYSKLRHEIAEDMDSETTTNNTVVPTEKTGLLGAIRKPAGYNEVRINDSFEEI